MKKQTSVVFIDSRVMDVDTLLAGVAPGTEVVMLDAQQDGLSQMAALLAGRSGIETIHVISHGAAGLLQLGSLALTHDGIDSHAADLMIIGAALSVDADILLYGCDAAAGSNGEALMLSLARLTGADVAASTDLTGNPALGGNWALEYQVGHIEASALAASNYQYLLTPALSPTTFVVSAALSADTGSSGRDFITRVTEQTISGTLSASLGADERVEVWLDGGLSWGPAVSTSGGNTWSMGITLSASNTFQARVSNDSGSSTPYSQSYSLDTTAATITISNLSMSADTGNSPSDFITNTAVQTLSATLSSALADGDVVYGSLDNGSTWVDITSKVSGTSLSWNGVMSAGSDVLKVKVADAAGNDSVVTTQVYVIDTLAPAAPDTLRLGRGSCTSSSDRITNDKTPTLSGTAEPGSSIKLYDGLTLLGSASVDSDGNWSLTTDELSDGTHSITATASDTAGNTSVPSVALNITIDTVAPTLSISSNTAHLGLGETATITFNASEAFIGFSAGDVTVASGTLSNFVGDGHSYTATFTLNAVTSSTVSLSVAAGSYKDIAGNLGENPAYITIDVDSTPPASGSGTGSGGAPITPPASGSGTGSGGAPITPPTSGSGTGSEGVVATAPMAGGVLHGSPFNDTLMGQGGKDTFHPNGGSDTIDGGSGIDSVVFGGARNDYTLTHNSDGTYTVRSVLDPSLNVAMSNVERLQFSDQLLAIDATPASAQLAGLYRLALGRNPDEGGLQYHLASSNSGASSSQIITSFVASNEFASGHGQLSNTAFLTQMYGNAFGRSPDTAGFAYWQTQLLNTPGIEGRALVIEGFFAAEEMTVQIAGQVDNGIVLLQQA